MEQPRAYTIKTIVLIASTHDMRAFAFFASAIFIERTGGIRTTVSLDVSPISAAEVAEAARASSASVLPSTLNSILALPRRRIVCCYVF